jgi:hypothetical protein
VVCHLKHDRRRKRHFRAFAGLQVSAVKFIEGIFEKVGAPRQVPEPVQDLFQPPFVEFVGHNRAPKVAYISGRSSKYAENNTPNLRIQCGGCIVFAEIKAYIRRI